MKMNKQDHETTLEEEVETLKTATINLLNAIEELLHLKRFLNKLERLLSKEEIDHDSK